MTELSPGEAFRLGWAGLVAAGYTPDQAWQMIRADAKHPAVRAIIAELDRTEDGRAALAWSRDQWAGHGFEPPWESP
jgi:hypothetical protein